MRVHDQFYPQAETAARKIHDEQCTGELHNTTGMTISLDGVVGNGSLNLVSKSSQTSLFTILDNITWTQSQRHLKIGG